MEFTQGLCLTETKRIQIKLLHKKIQVVFLIVRVTSHLFSFRCEPQSHWLAPQSPYIQVHAPPPQGQRDIPKPSVLHVTALHMAPQCLHVNTAPNQSASI